MKRIKETYLLFLIVMGLISIALYSTYALFTTSVELGEISLDTELKYTFKINSNQEFKIGANSKLRFNAIIENDMEGTISYGVYYKMINQETLPNGVTIAEVSNTNESTTTGPIEKGTENSITVPLVIINETNEEITIQIGVRTGYYTDTMNVDDIIYETGETLITDIVDSETAGSYQCDLSGDLECNEECYTKKENGYKNTYCDTTCVSTSISTELTNSELITNLDESGANIPELTDNLVPVIHNGTTWVTADAENSDETYQWYDYNAKKWANAVLLTSTKRNSLTKDANGNYTPGQTIGDTESAGVLAFYVWIPRYKYKVWNIDKRVGTTNYTYDAYTKGIDIVFEEEDATTGGITCTYSYASPSSSAGSPNEKCTKSGDGYYTHPAFTFGNDKLTGFWMGKFELSSSSPSTSNGGSASVTLTPRILPNVTSWRSNYVESYWKVIKDMQKASNIYGLSTDTTKVDTHMLTNMEWGAVAYLTHSKYGRCTGGTNSTCTEVTINSNSSYTTGYSNTTSYPYTNANGQKASTTGNIYGVYDMSGGAFEYVMGNMSKSSGSYAYNVSSAAGGGTYYTYSGNEKYLTAYAYGTSYSDQTAYNRGRLGDATSEVVTASGYSWYSDYAYFPYSSYPWFLRGGNYYDGSDAGVFDFDVNNGYSLYYSSSRGALAVFAA